MLVSVWSDFFNIFFSCTRTALMYWKWLKKSVCQPMLFFKVCESIGPQSLAKFCSATGLFINICRMLSICKHYKCLRYEVLIIFFSFFPLHFPLFPVILEKKSYIYIFLPSIRKTCRNRIKNKNWIVRTLFPDYWRQVY